MILRNKQEVSLKNFYKEFLSHVSNSLPSNRRLTKMELEVLTEFWALEGELVELDRFSTSVKKHIRENVFKFKNYTGLENYISQLYKKGYIVKKDGKKIINPNYDLPKERIRNQGKFTLVYEYEIV